MSPEIATSVAFTSGGTWSDGTKAILISSNTGVVAPLGCSVTSYCIYLSESVTQLFDEMSVPLVIALHVHHAVAPLMSSVLSVRTFTVTVPVPELV